MNAYLGQGSSVHPCMVMTKRTEQEGMRWLSDTLALYLFKRQNRGKHFYKSETKARNMEFSYNQNRLPGQHESIRSFVLFSQLTLLHQPRFLPSRTSF